MPIFGARDAFGRSRFGQANYGELSLYKLLPQIHRSLDEDQGFPIKKLFSAFQEELEDLRRQIDLLPFQRDPYIANGINYPKLLIITGGQAVQGSVQLTFDVPHNMDGVDTIDILGVVNNHLEGRYQVIEIVNENELRIDAEMNFPAGDLVGAKALKVDPSACLVEVLKVDVHEGKWGEVKRPLVKLTLTNKSNIDGLGIGFTGVIQAQMPVPPPENSFLEPDRALYKILYVRKRDRSLGGEIEVLCDGGVRLQDLSGVIPDRIVVVFKRPSSLSLLANDYGLVSDDNLPDAFQRTEIANVHQYLRLKSSRKAYEARSAGGGFKVQVTQLYKLCEEDLTLVPEQHVFIGTTGGGNLGYYTDLEAHRPRYDDLSGDIVMPSGNAITDVVLFTSPEFSDENQEMTAFFSCLFSLEVLGITYVDDPIIYEGLGFQIPIQIVKVNNPNPNAHGWEVGTLEHGSFSLVDPSENEYVVEGSSDGNRITQPEVELYIQATNVFFNVGDTLCVAYRPDPADLACCFCPSAEIMITIEALPSFMNQSGYSGTALLEAVKRILNRLKREQVPIHVHTAIERLVLNINVDAPSSSVDVNVGIEVESILVDIVEGQNFNCMFDEMPADEEELDTCALVLSYPGVVLDTVEGAGPDSDVIVDIVTDLLIEPVIELTVETYVLREIVVTGSAHFDDIPADDMDSDDPLAEIVPEVLIEVIIV